MPKEKINHPNGTVLYESPVLYADNTDGTTPTLAQRQSAPDEPAGESVRSENVIVQVGWHKDSWVQVSIEADVNYFRFVADYPDATDERSTAYAPPLTRDEINKLIRSLRRARDQVFGRDE